MHHDPDLDHPKGNHPKFHFQIEYCNVPTVAYKTAKNNFLQTSVL